MPLTDIFLTQIADPFRIGMIIALVYTMYRTRAETGVLIPLVAGVVFIAVLIPVVMRQLGDALLLHEIGVGLVTNTVILIVCLGLWSGYRRWRRRAG